MVKKILTQDINKLNLETPSQRILLEEFRLLQERYIRNRDEGIARMNFFITAASVALGGVLVFGSGNNVPIIYFKLILLVALIVLSAIGLDIFMWLISRDISADRFERGLARIRHYFVTLDPSIEEYFMSNVVDIPTNHIVRRNSGMRTAAQIVESFLLSLTVSMWSTFSPLASNGSILIGVVATVLIFIILGVYARIRLRMALKDAKRDIKFEL